MLLARLRTALALLVSLAHFGTAGDVLARPRATWKAAPGIDITPELRRHIDAVAAVYYAKTKRPLEITSGYRSPRRQAEAMYTKLAVGGSLALYRNQALTVPLTKAYREGRKKRWKRHRIIAAMAKVLEDQVAQGQFLSRHMRGLAFDVRSVGMTGRQRRAFLDAIREVGEMRVILEKRPPHYHVEIIKPKPRAPKKDLPPSAPTEGLAPTTAPEDAATPEVDDDDEPSEIPDDPR